MESALTAADGPGLLAGDGSQWAPRPRGARLADIKLGSNALRMMVYDQLGRPPLPLFSEKNDCRPGGGPPLTGLFAQERFWRAVDAASCFRAFAEAMGGGWRAALRGGVKIKGRLKAAS